MEKATELSPEYIAKVFKDTTEAFSRLADALNKLDKNGKRKIKNPPNKVPQQRYGKQEA